MEEKNNQSEPFAINQTRINRRLYFEAVRSISGRRKYRICIIGGLVLAPVCILNGSRGLAALALLVCVLGVGAGPLRGWRDFSKLKRQHPTGEWEKCLSFYEDRVETESESGRLTITPYEWLKKIRETEHLYILDFGSKAPASVLLRDGFIKGSMEEVKEAVKRSEKREADRRAGKGLSSPAGEAGETI